MEFLDLLLLHNQHRLTNEEERIFTFITIIRNFKDWA